jgi:hypothetical protein
MDDSDDSTDSDHDEVVDMYGSPGDSTAPNEEGDGAGDDQSAGGAGFGGMPVGPGNEDEEPERTTGRFYVKHTEDVAVTLHDIETTEIVTLVENPGLETHQILDATLVGKQPIEVSYVIDEIHDQQTIPVEYSDEPPTRQVQRLVTDMETGQAAAIEREGEGEIHILHVEPGETGDAAGELDDDETTYKNAARYGVNRVEIRTDEDEGIVSIRYLP